MSHINVLQIANQIKRETNPILEEQIKELIQASALGELDRNEAIAQLVVGLRSDLERFVVLLLQRVINELTSSFQNSSQEN